MKLENQILVQKKKYLILDFISYNITGEINGRELSERRLKETAQITVGV